LLASSAVAAGPVYVAVLSLVLIAATALLASARRHVLLIALDRPTAAAAGMRTGTWTTLLAAGVGTAVGACVPVAGALYVFGCLLLPALVARNTCREIGSMFAVAPIVAVASAVAAFVCAPALRIPPAELAVAMQAFLVPLSWLFRRLRRGG
jgi:manganese/iron transport system permease protein